jgi:hypothetical protein
MLMLFAKNCCQFVTSKRTLQKLPQIQLQDTLWAQEGTLCGAAPYGERCVLQSRWVSVRQCVQSGGTVTFVVQL